MILQLGDWVLQEACRQMRTWQDQHAPFGPLSVNLSGSQLRQAQLGERIAAILATFGLGADKLQLGNHRELHHDPGRGGPADPA